ncbi:unnamed protein product [Miscanthus lutarioriparius]|uniref:Tryptophan synthase beta chain-like PALP domain-containing protein n=1 Tax=Miscanthus lutarioriparius TaxID=422564 RepID=A0A811QV29_9POAL|nr:unnamed protein product [Miscanthus lutarioriparius]
MVGKQLFFKCECFQKAGAFKIRGASNSIFALDDEQASKGVVTHSSGNNAAAVALVAKLRGIPAHIVIPRNAPACKVENVKRYGGRIIWSDVSIESRESVCKKVQEETGAVLIHPFNDKYTIRALDITSGAARWPAEPAAFEFATRRQSSAASTEPVVRVRLI